MKANQQLVRFIRNAAIGVMVLAVPLMARATILNSDGSFGAQTLYTPIGGAWVNDNFAICHSAAQSPFTNVYSNDGQGADWAPNYAPHYIGEPVSPSVPPGSGTYYFNVDFKMTTTDPARSGSVRFILAQDYGAHIAVSLSASANATGGQLTITGGDGSQAIPLALDGADASQWYNVELAVDTTSQTFSGKLVDINGGYIVIGPRTFLDPTTTINTLFSDTYAIGPVPSIYSDNYAFSDSLLPTAAIPEPTTGLLLLVGAALIWRRSHRK